MRSGSHPGETALLGVKGWLALAGLLLLTAGGSLGFLAAGYFGSAPRRDDPEPESPVVESPPIFKNSDIYDRLGLAQGQRAQADRILSAHLQGLRRIRDERETLGKKVEEELLALLDEGQKEQMRHLMHQIKINDVFERVSQKVASYKPDLALAPKQEEEVLSVLLADQLKKDEFFRDLESCRAKGEKRSGEEVKKALDSMTEERDQKLRPILSDTQWARWKEIQKKRRDWMTGRHGPGAAGRQHPGAPAGAAAQTGPLPPASTAPAATAPISALPAGASPGGAPPAAAPPVSASPAATPPEGNRAAQGAEIERPKP
jgi:hypothetical protein